MSCVTETNYDALLAREMFDRKEDVQKDKPSNSLHAFTVISRMLVDSSLAPGAACTIPQQNARFTEKDAGFPIFTVQASVGTAVQSYAEAWEPGVEPDEIEDSTRQLLWLVVLLYGVGGLQNERPFVADFFEYVKKPFAYLKMLHAQCLGCTSSLRPSSYHPSSRAYPHHPSFSSSARSSR